MNINPNDLPLGFLLNTVGQLILAETKDAIADMGVSVVELGIIWLIELDEGRTQVEYANFQKRDVTTFGRYIDQLEARGFVRRAPVDGDRRAKSLWLTEDARETLAIGKACVLHLERQLFTSSIQNLDDLKAVLTKLLIELPH